MTAAQGIARASARASVALLLLTGGCTLRDRNAVALTLCERTPGCTTSDARPTYGPPQVQALDNTSRPPRTPQKK